MIATSESVAAVVTEDLWTTPFGKERGYRTAHDSETCKRVKRKAIVARRVRLDAREAGLPCAYCYEFPSESETTEGPTLPRSSVVSPSDGERGIQAVPPRYGEQRPDTTEPIPPDRDVVAVPSPRPTLSRPNRYAALCANCGGVLAVGDGLVVEFGPSRGAYHREGECRR